mmetsp:Transcript_19560/g.34530  ORF Transcript_19560/g.34530 Transcript_19560/m.34530 type:complete len:102 (-) Transcript_19560:1353-1658(-)
MAGELGFIGRMRPGTTCRALDCEDGQRRMELKLEARLHSAPSLLGVGGMDCTFKAGSCKTAGDLFGSSVFAACSIDDAVGDPRGAGRGRCRRMRRELVRGG